MIEEADRIDMAMVAPDGRVILMISDGGITTDPQLRFELLKNKLRTYSSYVSSDDFTEDFPGKSERDTTVRVMSRIPATSEMLKIRAVAASGEPAKTILVEYENFNP